jgi:hypothetical protein
MINPLRGVLRRARPIREDGGQALIEFLLFWPFFVVLVMIVVEFGLGLYNYQLITNSAREGARLAVVANEATPDEVAATIRERLQRGGVQWTSNSVDNREYCAPALPTTQVGISDLQLYGCRWEADDAGDQVRVGIRYGYELRFLGRFFAMATGDRTVVLATDFWMRNE